MTMRKLQRRRSAFRELLQNLDMRPLGEGLPPAPVGWIGKPRPHLAGSPRAKGAYRALGRR